MRVLFMGRNPIWIYTLLYGFNYAGHQIKASGPLTRLNLPRIIDEFEPDLVFTVGWGPELTEENQCLIRECVKAVGVPHFYWATEDPHLTQSFTIPLITTMQPDFVFTLTPSLVDTYRKMGISSAHLDFGYQPSIHRRLSHYCHNCFSVTVVANAYPNVYTENQGHYRFKSLEILIKPLLEEKIRIDFWGRDWDKMQPILGRNIPCEWIHGYLPYIEANKTYSSSNIVIGLQNYPTQLTQRTYEILGSGGLLLTTDTPEVRRMFRPGHDLLVSSSPEETVRLILKYLKHPQQRQQIRRNGEKAVINHTYKNRAEYIIDELHRQCILIAGNLKSHR